MFISANKYCGHHFICQLHQLGGFFEACSYLDELPSSVPANVGRRYICPLLTVTAAFYECLPEPKMTVFYGGSSGGADDIYSPPLSLPAGFRWGRAAGSGRRQQSAAPQWFKCHYLLKNDMKTRLSSREISHAGMSVSSPQVSQGLIRECTQTQMHG